MLSTTHRLTSPEQFREGLRRGRRCGGQMVVVHLRVPDAHPAPERDDSVAESRPQEPRVGFVVSKAVGNAVVRNRVKRRLRHLVRERLADLPPASLTVVRAQPGAATATFAELAGELDRCLEGCLRRVATAGGTR